MTSRTGNNLHRLIAVETSTGSRMLPCKVERSSRIRRICLQFDSPHYVTLKLPRFSTEKSGLRFVQQHVDWIFSVLDSRDSVTDLHQYLVKYPRLAISGCWYRLELQFTPIEAGFAIDHQDRIVRIALDPATPLAAQLKLRLLDIAREYLPRRIRLLEPRVGVKSHGVTVRHQKGRWGSCSETSGISLNWRLILLAPMLQDHVLLHELAHIRHFNHSSHFHALLRQLDPQAARHARQLQQAGSTTLLALGR